MYNIYIFELKNLILRIQKVLYVEMWKCGMWKKIVYINREY